ncbi:MAG: P1 family peptidase [Defluviitaleaceae bacterium]|nr:P1 family peptidase [Defluviitaleaceae bacterium]
MPKVRELGIIIGDLPTGAKNCITDVSGVKVGHVTLDYTNTDNSVACTGVTAIIPHEGNLFREKLVAASYVINGFGKTAGLVQIEELGTLESPIMLTNTLSVPEAHAATVEYMLEQTEEITSINIVTGECNDSKLNSIDKRFVTKAHGREALLKASADKCEEGAVGAGKGMVCFGYKGGIGTSSRLVPYDMAEFKVGVLTLTNFGNPAEFKYGKISPGSLNDADSAGSIMIILATDAPLSERQLKRVAKRCAVGLARTGGNWNHGSGDIAIAFSTANKIPHKSDKITDTLVRLREDNPVFNKLFAAAADATEEAVLNSMAQAETTVGKDGNKVEKFEF